jgi:hypothetical protein
MSIEQKLNEALLQYAGVQAIVSSRVYPTAAPAEAIAPFIVTRIIDKGPFTLNSEVERAQAQVTTWAESYTPAKSGAIAARAALDAAAVLNGLAAAIDTESDVVDPDTELYGVSLVVSLYADA